MTVKKVSNRQVSVTFHVDQGAVLFYMLLRILKYSSIIAQKKNKKIILYDVSFNKNAV